MFLAAIYLCYRQNPGIFQELRNKRKYFLTVEILTLVFFLAFLFVRYGNPDLWHPWKGGEKPMDFSYFNAVLKSTVFPPYDPWYAGGYLNYYYFGFVIAGVLVKWLGIVPAVAYNLLIPTFFSLIAMGAFSIAWNIFAASQPQKPGGSEQIAKSAYLPAIAAAAGMTVLGNLGTVRMIFQGYQRLAAPDGILEGAPVITRWIWAAQGFIQVVKGANLPYSIGDWYWIPSRAIPAPGDVEPITEFPLFTALYGDLHAHLLALPITLLALAIFISLVLSRARWSGRLGGLLWLLLAGLATGALRPTNTWDFPTYLALGVTAIIYALWKTSDAPKNAADATNHITEKRRFDIFNLVRGFTTTTNRLIVVVAGALIFVGVSFVLFQPYANWYALGYTKIDLWQGTHTPFTSYLTHWGLFLFLILAWMVNESIQWMAETPLSALQNLRPYRIWLQSALALLLAVVLGLLWMKVRIAWFVLPAAAWAGILLFKPTLPDAKRIMLFLIGAGLVLTLVVEVIVLRGDIGRMNTVFKFYLQVWTLFGVSAAAALAWTVQSLRKWSAPWRKTWQASLMILIAGAALYPLLAGTAKIKDRMAPQAPHTLDGMEYMKYATYAETWGVMDLSQDYRAIRWMQENVIGSPVIVEANLRNLYRWGSRYSIYTGLPGVVGWEWHQQQQRTVIPGAWVTNRILEIDDFYLTTDWEAAQQFLRKYDVQYIIVGQQERGHYPGAGLDKFTEAEGMLWIEVYRDAETVIYHTLGD